MSMTTTITAVPKNLEKLSLKELTKLEMAVTSTMVRRYKEDASALEAKEAEVAELRSKLSRIASELNQTTVKVFGKPAVAVPKANGRHKKAKATSVAVKYRDPKNPANTWSGRGRPARWLAAYEKQGAKRETFRVNV